MGNKPSVSSTVSPTQSVEEFFDFSICAAALHPLLSMRQQTVTYGRHMSLGRREGLDSTIALLP
jgi:hypothetical protein